MSNYDPVFAEPVKANHEGECQFIRITRWAEACSVPDCPVGRVSRDWIAYMKRRSTDSASEIHD